MKTQQELNALQEEVETQNKKLADLNMEKLETIAGGSAVYCPMPCGMTLKYGTRCSMRKEDDPTCAGCSGDWHSRVREG